MHRFHPRHIVTMVVAAFAALAVVLAPVAVEAAGQFVTVVGPNNEQALVSEGQLKARPSLGLTHVAPALLSSKASRRTLVWSNVAPNRMSISSLTVSATGPAGHYVAGELFIANRLTNYRTTCAQFADNTATAGFYTIPLTKVVVPMNQTVTIPYPAQMTTNSLPETGQPTCVLFRVNSTSAPSSSAWEVNSTVVGRIAGSSAN